MFSPVWGSLIVGLKEAESRMVGMGTWARGGERVERVVRGTGVLLGRTSDVSVQWDNYSQQPLMVYFRTASGVFTVLIIQKWPV